MEENNFLNNVSIGISALMMVENNCLNNVSIGSSIAISARRGSLSEEEWLEAIEEMKSTGRLIELIDNEEMRFFPVVCSNWKGEVIKDFTDARREYRKKKGYSPALI
jgi:hypothetical protein